MTLHRFFVNPNIITTETLTLPEEISHQITQVLRLKNNDEIILLDNTEFEYICRIIELNKKHTVCEILEKKENNNELENNVHLYMALIARDNFELVLQKSVELGVSEITPVLTERTQLDRKFAEGKYERWNKIIKEAAEQSERGKLPTLHQLLNFESAITQAKENGNSFIASEYARNHKKNVIASETKQSHINIFIGPEGGYTKQEIDYANKNNVHSISLGKTILRAETAAIALLAKIIS